MQKDIISSSSIKKTIICDIDGTLCKHVGAASTYARSSNMSELPNTIQAINTWDRLGYNVILITGRKESLRNITMHQLTELGVVFDQLIMGVGPGNRILINDKKPNGELNTCYAMNVVRNKGLSHYDFNSKYVVISDEQPAHVTKPWGSETLIEYNDHYVVKKLFMKKGEACSLQYHEVKRETIYVLSGQLILHIGKEVDHLKQIVMNPNEHVTIPPYTIHRMEAVVDSEYLESSSPELWDVVRLDDKYNRANTDETDYK